MPPYDGPPFPYDLEIGGVGYLRPPDEVMRRVNEYWFRNEPVPWFPDRQQTGSLTERQLPSKNETASTIRDRTFGFGWSDVQVQPEEDIRTYAYSDAVDEDADGDGQGVDCSVEGVAFLGPQINGTTLSGAVANVSYSFELTVSSTRYLYVVAGTKMFRSSNGTSFSAVQADGSDLPAVLTGPPQVFQGTQASALVYFPFGTSTAFRVWDGNPSNAFGTSASSSTKGHPDNNKVIAFLAVDDRMGALTLDDDALSQAYRYNEFQDGIAANASGADPTWLPSIAVSDRSDPAQMLLYAGGLVYVGCNRSLRTLDAERERLVATLWTHQPSTNNYRWWTAWRQELWFTVGQSTYRIVPQGEQSVFVPVGPEALPNNRTPVRGTIRAMAGDDYCLYAFLRSEGGITYLLKYRYYDGGRRAAFHSISRIGTYDVDYACISTVQGTNPHLYFGTAAGSIRYVVLPRNGYYPPNDSNCRFCLKGDLFESRQYGQLYFVNKTLIAWTGRAEALTSTETITPYYRTREADGFTQFGDVELNVEPGGRAQLDLPVTCAWWELRLRFERGGDASKTPVLLASTTNYNIRANDKGELTAYVWITDHAKLRNFQEDPRLAYEIEHQLLNLRRGVTLTTLRNKRGVQYEVLVDSVAIFHLDDEADTAVEAVARIAATEFGVRLVGTHDALDGYTHDQLDQYTEDELAFLP